MSELYQRQYHAFLSHAHADKAIVQRIYEWFNKAGFNVWYDSTDLKPGAQIGIDLAKAMSDCRSAIIVLSTASIKSGWVNEEYNRALAQRAKYHEKYPIIPINIENCEPPEFLETTLWVNVREGNLDLDVATNLLKGFYYNNPQPEFSKKDIYVSRTWRSSDAVLANCVCERLIRSSFFRLVGDSQDQSQFKTDEERIESIVSSCGALIAILSDRGGGKTSPYFLREIKIAQALGVPCVIVAEPTVQPPEISDNDFFIQFTTDKLSNADSDLEAIVDELKERWKQPVQPRYIFFGTSFAQEHAGKNQSVKDIIQRVTNVPCIMGEDIPSGIAQREIARRITQASAVLADISEDNLNTCIEAGIALGADRKLNLISKGPRRGRDLPYMFRDREVQFYADDFELMGIIHKLVYPYRRRILNYEVT